MSMHAKLSIAKAVSLHELFEISFFHKFRVNFKEEIWYMMKSSTILYPIRTTEGF